MLRSSGRQEEESQCKRVRNKHSEQLRHIVVQYMTYMSHHIGKAHALHALLLRKHKGECTSHARVLAGCGDTVWTRELHAAHKRYHTQSGIYHWHGIVDRDQAA
jgi:hypothetical protein